jgi:hypothetical protein
MRALEFLGPDGSWYAVVPVAEESHAIGQGWTRVSSHEATEVLTRADDLDGPSAADIWAHVNGVDASFERVAADDSVSLWRGDDRGSPTTRFTVWRVQRPLQATDVAQPAAAPLLSELGGETVQERTWVAFRLVDLAGDPLPDVPYDLELSDGSTVSGTTDGDGNARHEGIVRGACTVTFSELPDRYWQHEHNA